MLTLNPTQGHELHQGRGEVSVPRLQAGVSHRHPGRGHLQGSLSENISPGRLLQIRQTSFQHN